MSYRLYLMIFAEEQASASYCMRLPGKTGGHGQHGDLALFFLQIASELIAASKSCRLAGESRAPLHVAAAGMLFRMPRSSALQAAACSQAPAARVLWRLPVRGAAATSCISSYLAGMASPTSGKLNGIILKAVPP